MLLCVFGLSFLSISDTFSLAWPWQQSRLICSTLTPVQCTPSPPPPGYFKFAQGKEVSWCYACLMISTQGQICSPSPSPSALLFTSGKPSLWCEASLILISEHTARYLYSNLHCLLLLLTFRVTVRQTVELKQVEEGGREGGREGGQRRK